MRRTRAVKPSLSITPHSHTKYPYTTQNLMEAVCHLYLIKCPVGSEYDKQVRRERRKIIEDDSIPCLRKHKHKLSDSCASLLRDVYQEADMQWNTNAKFYRACNEDAKEFCRDTIESATAKANKEFGTPVPVMPDTGRSDGKPAQIKVEL